jgi:hypothetical protein
MSAGGRLLLLDNEPLSGQDGLANLAHTQTRHEQKGIIVR